jgi:hypothetical protein
MTEVWLHSNRRVLALGLVPVAAAALAAAFILVGVESTLLRVLAWLVVVGTVILAIGLVSQLRRPRIAYRNDHVLFNLRAGAPIAVPREIVEAFFLGQGPAHLPRVDGREPETVNLVARLSQKAPEWMHAEVKPALGRWCEGYVTIRGTWCEPLSKEVIQRLNARLRELRTVEGEGQP